jgi:hypothetical protein
MNVEQISSPAEAAMLLDTQPVRYTPGDATLYRCSVIRLDPGSPDRALIMMVNIGASHPETIVLREPAHHYDRWDAARWQREKLPEGWYGAAIALLGALGWARQPRAGYDPLVYREFEE